MFRQIFLLSLFFTSLSCIHTAVLANPPGLSLYESQSKGLTVELNLPPFERELIQLGNDTCDSVQIPDWMKTIETGYPELPTTGTLIQVPATGKITVRVIDSQREVLPQITPCPVLQPVVSMQGDVIPQIVKLNDLQTPYPKEFVKLSERAMWRDVTVVRLLITPFQWHPLTKELQYFTRLRIQVDFQDSLPSLSELRTRSPEDTYENVLRQTLINYTSPAVESSVLRKRVSLPSTDNPDENTVAKKVKTSDALRIEVNQPGIYRLSFADLLNAGLQPQLIRPELLSLSNQGQEVAIKVVSAQPGVFAEGDYLEFYGQNVDTLFTDANIYWLQWRKKGVGKRIEQRPAPVTTMGQPVTEFYDRLHLERNSRLWERTPSAPTADFWFWSQLTPPSDKSAGSFDYPLNLSSPVLGDTQAVVRVNFRGSSETPHHTQISLNGTVVSDQSWENYREYTQQATLSAKLLQETNTLTITLPGDTAEKESVYLDWMEIDYWRLFVAAKDSLTFKVAKDGKNRITINNFTKSDIILYDITNPYEISEIKDFTVEKNEKYYQLTFEDMMSSEKTYYAATVNQVKRPVTTVPWQPSHLQSAKNGADYILITVDEFKSAVQPLVDLRQRQGLRVKTVSVEDIYDEFNHGLIDPEAIKNFLKFAYENWQPPAPTYVMLVGDATVDYRGYLKGKKKSRVPVHLLENEGLQYVMSSSDNWYVSVQGDDILPEMLIGRIPGDTAETVNNTVSKIVRFEESMHESPRKVLLIADSDEKFKNFHEKIIFPLIPDVFTVDKVYLTTYFQGTKTKEEKTQKVTEARQTLIDSMNAGTAVTTYYGHGTSANWSLTNGLFSTTDISSLTNAQQLTFLLTMSCINGHFASLDYSIAEQFINFPKGVIAGLLPSNLSYPAEDVVFAKEIFSRLFTQKDSTLGSIITQAKIAAFQQGASKELVGIFTFFGDPATRLKPW